MDLGSDYLAGDDAETWWCNSHERLATHVLRKRDETGRILALAPCCAPNLGGILLPCYTVDLTNIADLSYE